MLALPQPSKFLIVDLPGAATSSSSAAASGWRGQPVRNIQGKKKECTEAKFPASGGGLVK